MGSHMKTTVEIADALFEAARRRAAERGTTLRALVEEGLRAVVESEVRAAPFRLRDGSVGGNGLQPDVGEGGWERISAVAYEGRGG